MRVLVGDDEPDVALLLDTYLRRRGHQSRMAFSGEQALKLLEAEPFDLVLSDLRMPGMTGVQLHDRLEAQQHPAAARMAFVTGNAVEADNQAFLKRTGCLWLDKPFDAATFGAFLEQVQAKLQSGAAES